RWPRDARPPAGGGGPEGGRRLPPLPRQRRRAGGRHRAHREARVELHRALSVTLPLALGISSTLRPTATYLLLIALVAAESAGVPLPGETALITASILASRGHVKLPLVIVFAVGVSLTGDHL